MLATALRLPHEAGSHQLPIAAARSSGGRAEDGRMSGIDWLVIVAGVAAIAWVNWYFFVAGRSGERPTPPGRSEG